MGEKGKEERGESRRKWEKKEKRRELEKRRERRVYSKKGRFKQFFIQSRVNSSFSFVKSYCSKMGIQRVV